MALQRNLQLLQAMGMFPTQAAPLSPAPAPAAIRAPVHGVGDRDIDEVFGPEQEDVTDVVSMPKGRVAYSDLKASQKKHVRCLFWAAMRVEYGDTYGLDSSGMFVQKWPQIRTAPAFVGLIGNGKADVEWFYQVYRNYCNNRRTAGNVLTWHDVQEQPKLLQHVKLLLLHLSHLRLSKSPTRRLMPLV
jgi:hypothetical protein